MDLIEGCVSTHVPVIIPSPPDARSRKRTISCTHGSHPENLYGLRGVVIGISYNSCLLVLGYFNVSHTTGAPVDTSNVH